MDRTSYHLRISTDGLSDKQRRKVANIFDEGLLDSVGSVWGGSTDLDAGWFDVDEKGIGEAQSVAENLIAYLRKKGLDRAFTVWEEPKYEWLGSVYHHNIDEPDTYGDCDAEGNLVVQFDAVLKALGESLTVAEAEALVTSLVAVET